MKYTRGLTNSMEKGQSEKLMVDQSAQKFSPFMEPEHSLPYSHQPGPGLYLEQVHSTSLNHIDYFLICILILPFHLRLSLQIIYSLIIFRLILYFVLISIMRATYPTHLILLDNDKYRLYRQVIFLLATYEKTNEDSWVLPEFHAVSTRNWAERKDEGSLLEIRSKSEWTRGLMKWSLQ
jgi:hypothetical protein